MQFDQLNGGRTPPCYDRTHGHAPGFGACHAAYESLDGQRQAWVFVNATGAPQSLEWISPKGRGNLSLAPHEIRLMRLK